MTGTHTYTEPGIYYGTVTGSDWGGGTDFATFVVRAKGQQTVTFPAVADHTYGEQRDHGRHRHPVRSAHHVHDRPAGRVHGHRPQRADDLPGRCRRVHRHRGAASPPADVPRLGARRAVLRRRPRAAHDHRRRQDEGLRRRQPRATPRPSTAWSTATPRPTSPGLDLTGPPSGADVGDYDITPSGATIPNYDIDYVAGTETITPAPLTVTADDKTKVYGADDPEFTASYDGLVNGDTEADCQRADPRRARPRGRRRRHLRHRPPPAPPAPTTTSPSSPAPRRSPPRR